MAELNTGVYMIFNQINGRCYVGSAAISLSRRWIEHRSALNGQKHRNRPLQNAWNKYREKSFAFVVLERVESAQVVEREQFWMDFYRQQGKRKLYNISPRAGSQLGFRHSAETIRRVAMKNRGRIKSVEERAKLSAAHKGRSNPWTVRVMAKHWPTLVSPEGKPHMIYNLTQFCKEHELDVSALRKVALEQKPSHKGWRLLKDGEPPTPFVGKIREYGAQHTVTAPDGTVYENVTNLEAFSREHHLNPVGMRQVAFGNYTNHHGWHVLREGYAPKTTDKRLRPNGWPDFRAPDGSVHPCANLYQFCKLHGLDKGAMQRLVKRQVKSHKNWTMA